MWILPKQLHTLDFVPDTAALSLDSNESSQLCAQSLYVRSRPSPLRTWLLKWKRDSWTQHLSGRILSPSHGQSFVTAWTSSLEVIPVSHFPQLENASAQKTSDIFGPTSQAEFVFSSPESASLKTSRDTSRWDSPQSSAIWKSWVTKCRGAYSARRNASMQVDAQHRINANECSSSVNWPTPDLAPDALNSGSNKRNTPKSFKEVLNWPTIKVKQAEDCPSERKRRTPSLDSVVKQELEYGPVAPENPNLHGSRPESWATPQTRDAKRAEGRMIRDGKCSDLPSQTEVDQTGKWNRDKGKLNSRWCETLMGLPVGWCMPSCVSLVTIVPTNCDF